MVRGYHTTCVTSNNNMLLARWSKIHDYNSTKDCEWHLKPLVNFLLLLLLSRFSRIQVCATPSTAAHQALRPWDSPGKNTGVGCHFLLQCMKVKSQSEVAQLCPTPRDPMDCSLPGSSVHGIFQARVLEWGAIAFSDMGTYWYYKTYINYILI